MNGLIASTPAPGWWSAILLPGLADRAWANPERLWNVVEACEMRRDSQLARSIKLALPCELAPDRNVALVRGFAQRKFVDAGVVVDVTTRLVNAKGEPQPFASMLMTTRAAVIVEDVSNGTCQPDLQDGRDNWPPSRAPVTGARLTLSFATTSSDRPCENTSCPLYWYCALWRFGRQCRSRPHTLCPPLHLQPCRRPCSFATCSRASGRHARRRW